jgi:hypothetical protein
VVVLGCLGATDGAQPTEDVASLIAAWRESGLRVRVEPWEGLATVEFGVGNVEAEAELGAEKDWQRPQLDAGGGEPAGWHGSVLGAAAPGPIPFSPPRCAMNAAVPLMAWSYNTTPRAYRRFLALLRGLRALGIAPRGDLAALPWISHKAYLLDLIVDDVPTVPTELVLAGSGASALRAAVARAVQPLLTPISAPTPALTEAGAGTRAGAAVVIKPAVAGGGEGVERLCLDPEGAGIDAEAGLSAAEKEASPVWRLALEALADRPLVVQPFLWRVRTCGELCCVFVNGELLHCVRKDPAGWHVGGHVGGGIDAQPVTRMDPPPAGVEATAQRALEALAGRCGLASPADIYLCRVDLLPGEPKPAHMGETLPEAPASEPQWLVSEIEVGWPHLFLRAGAPRAARVAAQGLLRHLCLPSTGPSKH